MDFFEHQEAARRRTWLLVAYYLLAVVAIVCLTYSALVAIFIVGSSQMGDRQFDLPIAPTLWQPELLLATVTATLTIIGGGTMWKVWQLSGGGDAVARALGGREVDHSTTDLLEKRLLNIVEEVSIASGTPVPRVFVLDGEMGINAFAAGYSPKRVSIAVTRGCLTLLSRDQLQGVIAHEFSHILNGDMRLNIRLIGILFGILMLHVIGRELVSTLGRSSQNSSSKRKKGDGGIVLFGVALMVIGGVGVFFANLIKSAISRQREFLADASAVQFTRNPYGIGEALKKIGGFGHGSRVTASRATEASHMFFANGVSNLWSSLSTLFATHPPLEERIKRILPDFDGVFPVFEGEGAVDVAGEAVDTGAVSGLAQPPSGSPQVALRAADVMDKVGIPEVRHLQFATSVLSSIAPEVGKAAREPLGAAALLCALVAGGGADVAAHVTSSLGGRLGVKVAEVGKFISSIGADQRLPLVDISLPALRALSVEDARELYELLLKLVRSDGKLSVFEFVVVIIVREFLEEVSGTSNRPKSRYRSVAEIVPQARVMYSALAYYGSPADDDAATQAFQVGMREFVGDERVDQSQRTSFSFATLERALRDLERTEPRIKRRLLVGAAACVLQDRRVTVEESELLRAFSEAINCPLPPLHV